MNFKRKKPAAQKTVEWSSPKALHSTAREGLTGYSGYVPYRHFPNRKFCKANKGEHKFEVDFATTNTWAKDKILVWLQCACGKKDLEFLDAKTLPKEKTKLQTLQTVPNRTRQTFQRT